MEEDGFTSFYVSDAVFIFTSALKEGRRYFNMRLCEEHRVRGWGLAPGQMGGFAFEGLGARSQVNLSRVGQI